MSLSAQEFKVEELNTPLRSWLSTTQGLLKLVRIANLSGQNNASIGSTLCQEQSKRLSMQHFTWTSNEVRSVRWLLLPQR